MGNSRWQVTELAVFCLNFLIVFNIQQALLGLDFSSESKMSSEGDDNRPGKCESNI